jgi:hypothetical protein
VLQVRVKSLHSPHQASRTINIDVAAIYRSGRGTKVSPAAIRCRLSGLVWWTRMITGVVVVAAGRGHAR